ncbi:hypothetical protein IQ276_027580 [Desmonostoc muscorum LEGE 12446]|uniref:Trypsin-co-occurring domain-containing protein n=1 Tax=Desmonostoc muscorum LEGE 12446 TaxID=1828758 RepID=A0A8J7ABV5_DESMC|nr:CU044_2847 family protein [Desmonostoc muscorum]MCF2150128.1 hypothetical protein [Desmonostoc muscorum LEGE 12446]
MPIIKSTSFVEGQRVEIYIEVDEQPQTDIEVDEQPQADVDNVNWANTRDGSAEKAAQKAAQAAQDVGNVFGESITLARKCAAQAIQNFQQMHDTVKPDELQLQLGIKVGCEFGAVIPVIAKGGAEAQIQVTMKWKLKETPQESRTQDTSQQLVNSVPK